MGWVEAPPALSGGMALQRHSFGRGQAGAFLERPSPRVDDRHTGGDGAPSWRREERSDPRGEKLDQPAWRCCGKRWAAARPWLFWNVTHGKSARRMKKLRSCQAVTRQFSGKHGTWRGMPTIPAQDHCACQRAAGKQRRSHPPDCFSAVHRDMACMSEREAAAFLQRHKGESARRVKICNHSEVLRASSAVSMEGSPS